MSTTISNDLNERYAAFSAAFQEGIGKLGVPSPDGKHHRWGLMLLWENLGQPITQDTLAEFYAENNLGRYDRQIRHMAASGWYMASSSRRTGNMEYNSTFPQNSIALMSITEKNPRIIAVRSTDASIKTWEEKVQFFEQVRGGCGMCGTHYSHYDKGHLVRTKPASLDNLVPLCTGCNNFLQAYNLDAYVQETTWVVRPIMPEGLREMVRAEAERERDEANNPNPGVVKSLDLGPAPFYAVAWRRLCHRLSWFT